MANHWRCGASTLTAFSVSDYVKMVKCLQAQRNIQQRNKRAHPEEEAQHWRSWSSSKRRRWSKSFNNNGCVCMSIFPWAPTLSSHFQSVQLNRECCNCFSFHLYLSPFSLPLFHPIRSFSLHFTSDDKVHNHLMNTMQCHRMQKKAHTHTHKFIFIRTQTFPLTHLWSSIPSKMFEFTHFILIFIFFYYLRCNFSLALFTFVFSLLLSSACT